MEVTEGSHNSLRSGSLGGTTTGVDHDGGSHGNGFSTPRSGSGDPFVGSSSTMILKGGNPYGDANDAFGQFTARVQKAKSRRILSQNPLSSLLDNKSLSRIDDHAQEEDHFGKITPAHSMAAGGGNSGTITASPPRQKSGGSGNGTVTVVAGGNGNTKLGTQFLYNLSKQDSVSSRTSQKSKSKSTSAYDTYKRSRANSVKGGTKTTGNGRKNNENNNDNRNNRPDAEREDSIETSDEYGSPGPHATQSTSVKASTVDDDKDYENDKNSNGDGLKSLSNVIGKYKRNRKGKPPLNSRVSVATDTPNSDTANRDAFINIEPDIDGNNYYHQRNNHNSNNNSSRSNRHSRHSSNQNRKSKRKKKMAIAESKADMFDTINDDTRDEIEMENMNKYDRYVHKSNKKNQRKGSRNSSARYKE